MSINELVMRAVVDQKLNITEACIQIGADRLYHDVNFMPL